jgi:hypothetical protein
MNDIDGARPSEPDLHQTAMAILAYLITAHEEAARLDENLFARAAKGPDTGKSGPQSVQGILLQASTSAASLVGFLRTMNDKAGSPLQDGGLHYEPPSPEFGFRTEADRQAFDASVPRHELGKKAGGKRKRK